MKCNNIVFLIFFSLFSAMLSAQTFWTGEPVLGLFEKPEKVEWVKYYKGRFNDINDVVLTLAGDGKDIKGKMEYLRSKTVFYLVGEAKKNNIILQEYDPEGLITGYLKGEYSESGIRGTWQNVDNNLGSNLKLEEVKNKVEVPSYCGDNKWVRIYTGNIGKDKARMILQKNGAGKVKGSFIFLNKTNTQKIKGYSDTFDNYYLTIKDEMNHPQGKIEGSFDDKNKFNVNYIKASGKEFTATFHPDVNLPVGCHEYADYATSYDVLYPKTRNESFNEWIEEIMLAWNGNAKKYMNEIVSMRQTPIPSMRQMLRAHAWTDIDVYNKDLISGQIHFSSSWTKNPTSQSLNFNLKSGKEILAKDIFKAEFDYVAYAKKYMKNRLLQHAYAKDTNFIEWLDTQQFETFNFRSEGIYFATGYHPLYGRQSVTIPYKKLKAFFVKNDIIENFIKGKY